ncbi:MAG: glycosyltransferase family 4 protein [Thermodesulfobacteriota bacterium]|nr:glycosyltransferase family 4 protein [Thermodesulfobacteriota bacterium]
MINKIVNLLEEQGHSVSRFTRTSADIPGMRFGRIRAFFCGIHCPSAIHDMQNQFKANRPDVVMIQNVFPFISTGVFPLIKKMGIPLVFRCGNFRLACPNGLFLSHEKICEKCVGGREYWCVLKNCERSFFKSFGYALRCAWTRLSGNVTKNTDMYITQTQFTREKFVEWGLPEQRIAVIPNFIDNFDAFNSKPDPGNFIGFVGRVSPEKDMPTLLGAAANLPDIPFKIAGDFTRMPWIINEAPENVKFLGRLDSEALDKFYADCRLLVLTSNCYEVFPVVLAEAMARGIPVVCSRIGGLPSIVEEHRTGLLFEPSNIHDLTEKISILWSNQEMCREMGETGRQKSLLQYTGDCYYKNLMTVFEQAIRISHNQTPQRHL